MLAQLCSPFRPAVLYKPRKGGFRQQIQQADSGASQPPPSKSKLVLRQILKWCQGDLSALAVHQTCCDGKDGGFDHPLIHRVAALQGDQHAHSELMRLLREETEALDLIAPVTVPDSVATHVLPPSKVIAAFLKHNPEHFSTTLGADAAALRKFWDGFKSQKANAAFFENHNFLKGMSLKQLSNVVPIIVHEDTGPVSKGKSANCISWYAITAKGNVSLGCEYVHVFK